MYTGMPTTTDLGEPDCFMEILDFKATGTGRGMTVTMKAREGYGDEWYQIIVGGIPERCVFVAEGETVKLTIFFPLGGTDHVVSAYPLGDWDNSADLDVNVESEDFGVPRGGSVQFDWNAVLESVETYGDNAQLSAFVLTGIERYLNCRPLDVVSNKITQAAIDLVLVDVAGTRTLTLSIHGRSVAAGSRVGNGSITLTERNASGVSGTVTVAYTADLALGTAWLLARWANLYVVTLAGAVTQTIYDTGRGKKLSTKLTTTSTGLLAYSITAWSDTGIAGTVFNGTVTVPAARPLPPEELALWSAPGDWTNTKIQFRRPLVYAGVNFYVYDSCNISTLLGGGAPILQLPLNTPLEVLNFPSQIEVVGGAPGDLSGPITLRTLSGAAAGKRFISVVNYDPAGVPPHNDDGEFVKLTIEYDAAGAVILPRPNIPKLFLGSTAGRAALINWIYDRRDEKIAATKILFYMLAEGDALPTDATVPFSELDPIGAASNALIRNTVAITAPSDGLWRFVFRAATATRRSENSLVVGPVLLSNAVPPVASGVSAIVVV